MITATWPQVWRSQLHGLKFGDHSYMATTAASIHWVVGGIYPVEFSAGVVTALTLSCLACLTDVEVVHSTSITNKSHSTTTNSQSITSKDQCTLIAISVSNSELE